MNKKILWLIVLSVIVSMILTFSFTGCKKEVVEETTAAETKAAETTAAETTAAAETKPEFVEVQGYNVRVPWDKDPKDIEIVALYLNITHEFATFLDAGVKAAAEEYGVNAYQTGSDNWGSEDQVKIFEQLLDKAPDGIVVCIADPPAVDPLVKRALEKGIPVCTYNVDSPASGRFSYSGQDLYLAGAQTAEYLMAMLEKKGVVDDPSKSRSGDHIKIVVTDPAPELFADQERFRGVMDVLDKYENIEVVGPLAAFGTEEEVYSVVENAYNSNKDLDGVIEIGGPVGVFWGRFFKTNNIGNNLGDDPIYAIGHDVHLDNLLQIKEGWFTMTVGQNPFKQGYQSVSQMAEFLITGNPDVFKTEVIPTIEVDINNVDEFIEKVESGEPIG